MSKHFLLLVSITVSVMLIGRAGFAQNPVAPDAVAPTGSDTIPPPQPPFVRVPADYSHWMIKFDHPKSASPAKPGAEQGGESSGVVMSHDKPVHIDAIEYAKTGDTGCASMALVDGERLVRWASANMVLSTYPGRKDVYIDRALSLVPEEGRFMSAYPYFGWLEAKDYAGVAELGGVKCYHFRQEAKAPKPVKIDPKDVGSELGTPETMAATGHAEREAWVTVDGRWPLAYRDEGGMRRFTQLQPPPPGQKLQLPPAFQAQLDLFLGRK